MENTMPIICIIIPKDNVMYPVMSSEIF